MSLFLVGCSSKEYIDVPYMVGCEQFGTIAAEDIPLQFEPIHQADVLHTSELDANKTLVYRNLAATGLGDHSYKHASIIDSDLLLTYWKMVGDVINQIHTHNDKVKEYKDKQSQENNKTSLK